MTVRTAATTSAVLAAGLALTGCMSNPVQPEPAPAPAPVAVVSSPAPVVAAPPKPAEPQLPVGVRKDLIQRQILTALETENFTRALELFLDLRRLGGEIAPNMLYLEGKTAVAAGDKPRAKAVLAAYFQRVTKEDKDYASALSLYELASN